MMYVYLVGYDPMEESELQRSLDLIVSSTEGLVGYLQFMSTAVVRIISGSIEESRIDR